MLRALARFSPIGRATAALWAWRNRRELGRWLSFAWRAIPPSAAARQDLLAEGRLRVSLSKQQRTRGSRSLAVRVAKGVAILEGHLSPELHDLVASMAESTKGVDRVECSIRDRGSRRTPMSHAHTIAVAEIPPMPG